MRRTTHLLTPTSLKALAHPVRVELLGLLRADGPATATGLAGRLGESSGTTSYHLRQLAGAGFVVEDDTRGNGRERWWRAAQDSTELSPADWQDDPAVKPAVDAFLRVLLQSLGQRAAGWLSHRDTTSRAWRHAATFSDARLHLSAAELRRLNEQIEELVESYRREPRRGDRPITLQWQGFPETGP